MYVYSGGGFAMHDSILNDKSEGPSISVIIPFYNLGDYARPCMESLLLQEYSNCEYICVDDGSTDNTLEILKEFSADDRVKIYHKENGGLSDARNYGLDKAAGDYITFIDGDDYVHPQYLLQLAAGTDMQKERIVISPLRLIKYKEPMDIKEGWANVIQHSVIDKKTAFEKILYDELSASACGKLVPREAYCDIRFPKGKVSEEVAIIGKLIRKYEQFSVTDKPLYGYVMRTGSIGHKKKVPYREIRDRIDALKLFEGVVREEFDIDNDSVIKNALQYRWGLRLVDMALLYERVDDDKEAVIDLKKKIKKWLDNNIKEIMRNKRASFAQRMRIWLYTYSPGMYILLFSLYKRIKHNV